MKNFKNFQFQTIITKEHEIAEGDYIIDNTMVIRCSNGLLDDVVDEEGHVLPAIEFLDGSHIEHWKKGVLHCETEPAVIDSIDNYEEWWLDGIQKKDSE